MEVGHAQLLEGREAANLRSSAKMLSILAEKNQETRRIATCEEVRPY